MDPHPQNPNLLNYNAIPDRFGEIEWKVSLFNSVPNKRMCVFFSCFKVFKAKYVYSNRMFRFVWNIFIRNEK